MNSICYVVDAPFLGGAELYISRLAAALDRREFRACVLMRAGAQDPHLATWADHLRSVDIRVDEIPMRLPFAPMDAVRAWRAIEKLAPDVVHLNMPGPYDGQMGLVLPIARAAGARTVVTEHLPMVRRLWKRAAVKMIAYRSLDLAVTMTEANARFLVDRQGAPAARVRVVPNGIPRSFGASGPAGKERRWALGLRDGQVAIVYAGHILPHKGLRRLIEAIAKSTSRENLHLLVVGAGPDEAACRQLCVDRGLSRQVTFLGWRTSAETEQLLAAGDLLALPSEIEGLPYVLLEAMASRLPVIAGRVYGIPEVVQEGVTGLLVDPQRIDEIATALDRLASDPGLRIAMGTAARERFEQHFTLERQVASMEMLYRALLHGSVAASERV